MYINSFPMKGRGIRLGQGVKKLISEKLISATDTIKKAQKDLSKANISGAIAPVKARVSGAKGGMKLGAGETVSIDGKLPVAVISGLTAIGVDVSELSLVEDKWILNLSLPELYYNQIFNFPAFRAGLISQFPNAERPATPRLENGIRGIDAFRDSVAENDQQGRRIFQDARGQQTLNELQSLMAWAKNIHPTNVYLIVDGELGKLEGNMNARIAEALSGVKKMLGEVSSFIVSPRDAMLVALVTSMKDSFTTIQTAIDQQGKAMEEITALYTGIAATAEAVTGQPAGAGDDPVTLLNKVRDTATNNKQLLETEITKLQGALNEITKALGV